MVSLTSAAKRFETPFNVIEGGSGIFRGVLDESSQKGAPNYVFTDPRRIIRVAVDVPIQTGMVIESIAGEKLLVADNGPGETARGVIWKSFRLFKVTRQVAWTRRRFVLDPVTQLKRDAGMNAVGNPWVVLEPMDRETNDSKLKHSFESTRFISGVPILADDLIDGHTVTKADPQLGLYVGVYSA